MENQTNRELTFGEKRVQRKFNPSEDNKVDVLKRQYAGLLDLLEYMKEDGKDVRCLSIAQTELETSCMYAVKSLFV